MKTRISIFFIVTSLIIASSFAYAERGSAIIDGTTEDSNIGGSVRFQDTEFGVKIKVDVRGLTPGKHGFHIHQYGSCKDGGKAAGGHFNPDNIEHGFVPEDSVFDSHPGDLGNIVANDEGEAYLEMEVEDLSLSEGLYNIAGRAVIIHEKEDDFGQPTGNAGGRIGCGTIVIIK